MRTPSRTATLCLLLAAGLGACGDEAKVKDAELAASRDAAPAEHAPPAAPDASAAAKVPSPRPSEEIQGRPALSTLRLATFDRHDTHRRASRDNVSGPVWDPGASPTFELSTAPGARVWFEIARKNGRRKPLAPPSRVELEWQGPAGARRFEGVVTVPDPATKPWFTVRVDLPAGWTERGRFQVWVEGELLGEDGPWVTTVPRVCSAADSRARPNVLWITVDTLRADFLGCYGHTRPTSANLDRLAASSVVFERAISQASWTLPSYVSALTGMVADGHGILFRNQAVPQGYLLLPELFADEGYATAAFVSGTFTDDYWGLYQGFDTYDDMGQITDDADEATEEVQFERFGGAEDRITSPEITAKASRWLEQHQDERFLLFVHYFDPHGNYREHAEFAESLPPEPPRPPVMAWERTTAATPNVPLDRAHYEQEIAFTDASIGELLAKLTELGLDENTLVVFHADHGEEFFERFGVGHGHQIFDEVAHVPLMMRVPGVASARVSRPVGVMDLAPTIAELCAVEFDRPPLGGESLVPTFRDPAASRTLPVISSWYFWDMKESQGRGWLRLDDGDFSYLHGNDAASGEERRFLFRASDDPVQSRDRSAEFPEALARFQELETELVPALDLERDRQRQMRGGGDSPLEFDAAMREKLERLHYLEAGKVPGSGDGGR